MDNLDIRKDAEIDQFNLDLMAKELPSLMGKYYDAIRRATERINRMKFQLEKEEAVARIDARKALARDGTKPTQSMVDDAVTALPAIFELRRELADEEKERDYLKAGVTILDAKRGSLNNLVSLYIKEYFSNNSAENGNYREADVKRRQSVDYSKLADEETSILNSALRKEK